MISLVTIFISDLDDFDNIYLGWTDRYNQYTKCLNLCLGRYRCFNLNYYVYRTVIYLVYYINKNIYRV